MDNKTKAKGQNKMTWMIRHLQPSIKDCNAMDENRWGNVPITGNLTSLLESEHPDMFSNFPLNICYYGYDFCCYHRCHYFSGESLPKAADGS